MIDTPIINLLCLIPSIAKADKNISWRGHRVLEGSLPQRMDVVIFKWFENESQLYIKRIVGMPKDTLQIIKGVVYINNRIITEKGERIVSYDNFGPVLIPDKCYFVMGDFRTNSLDSRTKGLVPQNCIMGKAVFKLWHSDCGIFSLGTIE